MRKTLQIVGIVPSHFEDPDDRAFPFYRPQEMIPDSADPLFDSRWSKIFAGLKKMFDLVEDPGIADGRTTDQQPVDA